MTILVVAATERELAGMRDLPAVECLSTGVGPVEAAAVTAAALVAHRASVVLHVGLAGARLASHLRPPMLVLGHEAHYCDMTSDWAPRIVAPSSALLAAARRAVPEAPVVAIGTSARVGGTSGCDVEAMEGFAVLRAAAIAGVPAIEMRAISNAIEEADRSKWQFDAALSVLSDGVTRVVAAVRESAFTSRRPPR